MRLHASSESFRGHGLENTALAFVCYASVDLFCFVLVWLPLLFGAREHGADAGIRCVLLGRPCVCIIISIFILISLLYGARVGMLAASYA